MKKTKRKQKFERTDEIKAGYEALALVLQKGYKKAEVKRKGNKIFIIAEKKSRKIRRKK